jgi:hypothetical protein
LWGGAFLSLPLVSSMCLQFPLGLRWIFFLLLAAWCWDWVAVHDVFGADMGFRACDDDDDDVGFYLPAGIRFHPPSIQMLYLLVFIPGALL